jgi:cell division transport system permease protein
MRAKMTNAAKSSHSHKDNLSGRLRYYFGRSFTNIRQNLLINTLTTVTIFFAILLISIFLMVYANLEKMTEQWSEKVQVTAYFENEPSPQELAVLKSRILALKGTGKVSYVTKKDALERFRSRLQGQNGLLEGVSADILPASLEITLKKDSRGTDALAVYVDQLKKVPGVRELQYGEEWVKRFNNVMDVMKIFGLVAGSFLVLAVVFIVANTIKLTIYSRKDEVELLGLVGATRMFIKIPFMLEGMLQGMVGSVLAMATLFGIYFGLMQNPGDYLDTSLYSGLVFLPLTQVCILFIGGTMLGFIGSMVSLKRFINV